MSKFYAKDLTYKVVEGAAVYDVSDDFIRVMAGLPRTGLQKATRYKFDSEGSLIEERRVLMPRVVIE